MRYLLSIMIALGFAQHLQATQISNSMYTNCDGAFNPKNIPNLYFNVQDYIPAHPQSIAATHPNLYDRLRSVYQALPSFRSIHAINLDDAITPAKVLMRTYYDVVANLSTKLRDILNDYFNNAHPKPRAYELIKYILDDLTYYHPDAEAGKYWYQNVHRQEAQRVVENLEEYPFPAAPLAARKRALGALNQLSSHWLELFVALNVHEWQGNNIRFQSIPAMWDCPPGCGLASDDGKKEIDVLWEENDVWNFAEVKFGYGPLNPASRSYEAINKQIKDQQRIVKGLAKANDRKTAMHLFYFPGMTQKAYDNFMALGVILHTKILPEPAIIIN